MRLLLGGYLGFAFFKQAQFVCTFPTLSLFEQSPQNGHLWLFPEFLSYVLLW